MSQPALDATIGATTSNSYATAAQAVAFWSMRYDGASFVALTTPNQELALMHATKLIDEHRFFGFKLGALQALEFPRIYPFNSDEPLGTTAAQIPQKVIDACCIQAKWIADNAATGGQTQRQKLQQQGVKSFRVGDVSENFGDASASFIPQTLCPEAYKLMQRWIDRTARIVSTGRERTWDAWTPLP